jgi:hypothetical protein
MSEIGGRRPSTSSYTNGRNRRGGRGSGGGGGGRGRGRGGGGGSGGGGGRGRGKVSQDNYTWTAGGAAPSYPVTTWTAGGGADDNNINNATPQFEDLNFSRESQSGLIYGLKEDVIVPGSVNQVLLQGEILETLKRMPSDIVNLMLAQYDTCAREGGIRNRNAYLLGIINSGPRMGLPQGVVVPPSVKFSLMQGVVLDDLNALEVPEINLILGEFDKEMRARGSTIYDKYSFLADIIRKHIPATPKRNKKNIHQYAVRTPANGDGKTPSSLRTFDPQILSTMNDVKLENGEIVPDVPIIKTSDEMEDTLALLANSMERIQMLTESLGKVRGELVAEREKRSSQEAIARSEQILREATEERLESALKELDEEREARRREQQEYQTALKYENDRRNATEQEIKELRERLDIERAEKHRAEDRLSVLEEVLISERDVRDHERSSTDLPEFNSVEFDSDGEH